MITWGRKIYQQQRAIYTAYKHINDVVSSRLLAMFLNRKMVCECDIMYRYKYAVGFMTTATQKWNTAMMICRSLYKVLFKYTAYLLHTECTIPSQTFCTECTYCYLFLLEMYLPQGTLHDRISPNKKFYRASSFYWLNINFFTSVTWDKTKQLDT